MVIKTNEQPVTIYRTRNDEFAWGEKYAYICKGDKVIHIKSEEIDAVIECLRECRDELNSAPRTPRNRPGRVSIAPLMAADPSTDQAGDDNA